MTPAGRRAAFIGGLEFLAARMRADDSIPVACEHWALVFRADDPEQMAAIAASLAVEDAKSGDLAEEDGWPGERIRGRVGGVPVEVTAEAGPVLLAGHVALAGAGGSR